MPDDPVAVFISKLAPVAKAVEVETGIDHICGMAQACHESNAGQSELSNPPGNNLFGFTAEGTYWITDGKPVVKIPSVEYVNGEKVTVTRIFRAYPNWDESYEDWARLMQAPHYVASGTLAALKNKDRPAFAASLVVAGYATDPNYPVALMARIAQIEKETT